MPVDDHLRVLKQRPGIEEVILDAGAAGDADATVDPQTQRITATSSSAGSIPLARWPRGLPNPVMVPPECGYQSDRSGSLGSWQCCRPLSARLVFKLSKPHHANAIPGLERRFSPLSTTRTMRRAAARPGSRGLESGI